MEEETVSYFTCPMHPDVLSKVEGMCPECGMRLVPISIDEKSHHPAHSKHAGHSKNIFKIKFWVSFILSIPVVIYSDVVQNLLGFTAPSFPGSFYLQLVFASVIFFYGGSVFLTSASRELKARLPGMMTLIALAITTAYVYSIYVVLTGGTKTLFWELATLITIMLLGHWVEMRAVSGAQSALKELSQLLPDTAEVLRGDGVVAVVPLYDLVVGDLVLVKPGGRIPADGIVVEGSSDVNEAIITGESGAVAKENGSEVIAGTTNGDGSLKVRVSKIGEETFLSGVMRLVAEAEASKSRLQILSDRAAYYLTIVAVVSGGVTLSGWLAVAAPAFAFERMVAVLVIACPHALGLAIPLVASISTTKAARNGFLVKRRLALEAARNIDIVLFDKTGTLTKGEFGINEIVPIFGNDEKDILQIAASVNSHSEHPIAKALTIEAGKRSISILPVSNFLRLPGKGVSANVDGSSVLTGSSAILDDRNIILDSQVSSAAEKLSLQGKTIIFVLREAVLLGFIALADVIRDESREAVKSLHKMGIKTAMITGDSKDVAKWVAGELGIDEYFWRVQPEEKSAKVKILQDKGQRVAMVGDGVNDAPALTLADLGVAVGAGTNVAIESAGIILVRNDPRDIPRIIKLSKLTYNKMIQNLWWASGYNIIAIPLAAGVLATKGILLQPALAALFMSLSTVIVAGNAMLLRRKSLD